MTILLICLSLMVLAAFWTVLARSLLRSMLGLALVSVAVTIVMFLFSTPLAAVFELSVCAGLITVILAATVSLTRPMTDKEAVAYGRQRLKKYWFLPVLALAVGASVLVFLKAPVFQPLAQAALPVDVRHLLWHDRVFDLIGQILLVLLGSLGVVILFKEIRNI
jgi:NADH-quinone oxidoreductase subunit J